ncbi:MAG: hypothetical protein IT429_22425 [Gemmataceae bacterium]|nr:hypothetical protein [Gemmataceae bacterium]
MRHGLLAYSWGDVSQSGDIASAVKPIISTLLFLAVQEGRLRSVDETRYRQATPGRRRNSRAWSTTRAAPAKSSLNLAVAALSGSWRAIRWG